MKWSRQHLLSTFARKTIQSDLIDIWKHKLMQAILFCLDHTLLTPWCSIILRKQPIEFLETSITLSEYMYKYNVSFEYQFITKISNHVNVTYMLPMQNLCTSMVNSILQHSESSGLNLFAITIRVVICLRRWRGQIWWKPIKHIMNILRCTPCGSSKSHSVSMYQCQIWADINPVIPI